MTDNKPKNVNRKRTATTTKEETRGGKPPQRPPLGKIQTKGPSPPRETAGRPERKKANMYGVFFYECTTGKRTGNEKTKKREKQKTKKKKKKKCKRRWRKEGGEGGTQQTNTP